MQGLTIDGFSHTLLSDDGKTARIVFLQDGNEFYLEVETTALAAFLPMIVDLANAAHVETPTCIQVSGAEAVLDTTGEVMVNLEGTAQAQYWFALPRVVSEKLSVELQSLLGNLGPSNSKH